MREASFLDELRREILSHPALDHPFLERVATTRLGREAYRDFLLQLYPHCHLFIGYMEDLLVRGPSSAAKLCLAKILLDEYGEDAHGEDHPALFRRFLAAAGARDEELLGTPLDPVALDFVRLHLELTRDEPFLVGLGAIGPGHELTIPIMFPKLCAGMRLSGFSERDIEFFSLHAEHDVEHASMIEDELRGLARGPEAQAQVRRGALRSLDGRAAFWSMCERRVFGGERRGGATLAELVAGDARC